MGSCEAPYCGGWPTWSRCIKGINECEKRRGWAGARNDGHFQLPLPFPHQCSSFWVFKTIIFLYRSFFMPTCVCAIICGLYSVQQSVLQEEGKEGGRFSVIYLMKKCVCRRKSNSLYNSLTPLYLSAMGCIISSTPQPSPRHMNSHMF